MLRGILEKSQKFNFLGNPPIDDHIRNAMGFAQVIHEFTGENQKGKIYDLGSGGGVPALVLIEKLKETNVIARSTNENTTKTKSNLLHPSDQYGFQPKPYIFIAASTKKAKVKKYDR